MKILITGANGFLGSWIGRILGSSHSVTAVIRPNADTSNLSGARISSIAPLHEHQLPGFISNSQPDVVILCDWWGVGNEHRNSVSQFDNVSRFQNRISWLRKVKTVIALGSQAELGPRNILITEDEIDSPTTKYGRAKVEVRKILEKDLGSDVRFVWARIFSTYGPLDSENWLIPSTIRSLLRSEVVALTRGEQEWSFLHAFDLGHAFDTLVSNGHISGVVNVGNPKTNLISEVATSIGEQLGKSGLLNFGALNYRKDQVMKLAPITTKLSDAGWAPRVEIKDGVLNMIEWMTGHTNPSLKLINGDEITFSLPHYIFKN